MGHLVTLLPSGQQFSAEPGEPILEAALRAQVVLPYGCRNGACGSCKARVVGGTLQQDAHSTGAMTQAEKQDGFALLCCAVAQTDLTVEARVLAGVGDIPVRKMPCRIASIERPTNDVAIVRLQLPATERLQFLAGQYVDIILKDGARRSYSIAVPPHAVEDGLELHIRHFAGGRFTDALFGITAPEIKVRDILRFEGPLGTFFLREDSQRPLILVASGTGFAPIQAMVEHARSKRIDRPMTLYWGGRRPADLYRDEIAQQWAREIPDFRYVPVVSEAQPEDQWTGRTGFVHLAVLQDFPHLEDFQVYACGAPVMVEAARRDFSALAGLPVDEFFADSFTTAADEAAAHGGPAGTA